MTTGPGFRIHPYQALFPIGVAFAIAGALLWLLHGIGWIGYPASDHANWMVGGFLLSFSAGFLMTAIPKFTGAFECRPWELGLATLLACAQWAHVGFSAALYLFLVVFAFRRFRRREYSPPPHFIFVGLGFALGLIGSAGMAVSALGGGLLFSMVALRVFFLQGSLLCFVVGVGARLVRVLFGYEGSPLVQISTPGRAASATGFPSETGGRVYGSFLLMLLGFSLELVPGMETIGRVSRALGTSWIAFSAWRIHRRPPRRGALSAGLYFGCWCITLGTWAYALFRGWEVHSAHLLFVGGFTTLALMVASRVVLAHGGYPLGGEVRSAALRGSWILILFAMITRVSAPLLTGYFSHLTYGAIILILALLIWGFWMARRLGGFRAERAR